jgi:Ca2+/H+ antiporter, TMEM165/GDT1 family
LASITVALTTFAVIFLAELPDKTALASVVLGTRYHPLPLLCGVGTALAVQVVLAVAAGSLLGLLPHHVLGFVVAGLFLAGAAFLVFTRVTEEEVAEVHSPARFWLAAGTSFMVILVAEFGDLTQILTASLAAKYHDPVAVGLGSVTAMWIVAVAAILGGRSLLRLVPAVLVTRAAAVLMLALAGFSLASAIG